VGERRVAHSIHVEKPEGKRQFGRPRRRQEDDITVYLQEVGYGENDWIYLIDSDRC